MKKLLLMSLMAVAVVSCSKKTEDPEPEPTPTTNSAAGNWTIKSYDGLTLAAPAAGTLNMTSTSTTAGTAHFDITFDGSAHSTEDDNYTLSNSNANIAFTKTGGNFNVLGGGGTWTINTLNATTLKMTSSFGLVIECTK